MISGHNNRQQVGKHKENIKDYFSKRTLYWKNVYNYNDKDKNAIHNIFMRQRRDAILQLLRKHANGRSLKVLDAGCGPGSIMKEVLGNGHCVVGIDISHDMVRETKNESKINLINSAYLVADIEELPFRTECFDAVICSGVLQYLQSDQKSINEMSKVIKKNGILIVDLPNILRINNLLDPYYYFYRGFKYIYFKICYKNNGNMNSPRSCDFGLNRNFENRRYFYGQLNKLCKGFGLNKVDNVPIGFEPLTFFGKEFLPRPISINLSNFLVKLCKKKFFRWLIVFSYRWVFSCKKVFE